MPDDAADIIAFSLHRWHQEAWKNRHQIISRLTRWHRILYVEEPFDLRDVLGDRGGRGRGGRGGVEALGERLTRYRPPKYLPRNYRFPGLERACRRLRIAHLRAVCRSLKIRRPVLLVWDPEFRYVLGRLDESLRAYFVDDQYSLFSGGDGTALAAEERALLRGVDLVFCTSEALCEDKGRVNPNVHLVANGVDYAAFAAAATGREPVPSALRAIRRPILGFVGNLDDKVDYGLLTGVVRDNPGWSVVLIGPDNIFTSGYRAEFETLRACANVTWLGSLTPRGDPRPHPGHGRVRHPQPDRRVHPLRLSDQAPRVPGRGQARHLHAHTEHRAVRAHGSPGGVESPSGPAACGRRPPRRATAGWSVARPRLASTPGSSGPSACTRCWRPCRRIPAPIPPSLARGLRRYS